jgi:hypothetical protein
MWSMFALPLPRHPPVGQQPHTGTRKMLLESRACEHLAFRAAPPRVRALWLVGDTGEGNSQAPQACQGTLLADVPPVIVLALRTSASLAAADLGILKTPSHACRDLLLGIPARVGAGHQLGSADRASVRATVAQLVERPAMLQS